MEFKKTNRKFYPFYSLGNYFKLKEGKLISSPMLTDGKRKKIEIEVEHFTRNIQRVGKILLNLK